MNTFKKINEGLYMYKESGQFFLLEKGVLGVYGAGKCWRLWYCFDGNKINLGCFCTHSDGYHCEKKAYKGILWRSFKEILTEATAIVSIVEDISK